MTSQTASWSILVYIAAHNNLYRYGKDSLEQIKSVGSTESVKLAVLYDGYAREVDGVVQPEARRFVIGAPGMIEEEAEYKAFDSGDPEMLIETAKWAFKRNPAKHYGIVLWSHGTGYWNQEELEKIARQVQQEGGPKFDAAEQKERAAAPGSMALFRSTLKQMLKAPTPTERAILFDDGTQHSLDTLELERVMSTIQEEIGQPIDLLGFDACLMANIEVAYQLRNCVRCMVASEELMPATSWPYPTILSRLIAKPNMAAEELARVIVQEIVAFYEPMLSQSSTMDLTQIALDLNHIKEITHPINALSASLRLNMADECNTLWQAQSNTMQKETRGGMRQENKQDVYLSDIKSLSTWMIANAKHLQVRQAATEVVAALLKSQTVLTEEHRNNWFKDIGGLSIYMPWQKMKHRSLPLSSEYVKLAFAQDTGWAEILKHYQTEVQRQATSAR